MAFAAVLVPLLTGCGSSLASATTTLHGAQNVDVVHSDGTVVRGTDGLHLRPGDVVRTAADGRAELHTRGRVVYEGSLASVQLIDGARDDLRHGAVVVDAQHGPGLTLTVAGLTARTPGGAAMRAERAVTTRIAALAGTTSLANAGGLTLAVGALTQAVVGGDALPQTTADSPLRLTDDDGEAHAVPTLVRDDVALEALAAGVDSTGGGTARLVSAAWHRNVESLPAGMARSEQVLPIVIAAASRGDVNSHYADAVRLRILGASWGVVAHRLGVSSDRVLAAFDVFERGAATGAVGSVPAALQYLVSSGVGGSTPSPHGGGHRGSGSGSGSGTSGRAPSPRPSPSSSPTPGPVSSVVDTLLSLLPFPLPTPTPSATPTLSLPVTLPAIGGAGNGAVTPAPLPTALLH